MKSTRSPQPFAGWSAFVNNCRFRRQAVHPNYRGINSLTAVGYTTPNSPSKIAQEVHFQVLTRQRHTRSPVEVCRYLLPFVAPGHYIIIIIYSRTACLFIYKRLAITGSRSVGGSARWTGDEIRI
jgi:hypothetical protein